MIGLEMVLKERKYVSYDGIERKSNMFHIMVLKARFYVSFHTLFEQV